MYILYVYIHTCTIFSFCLCYAYKCNYAKLTRFNAHFQLDKMLNLGTLELKSPKICIRGVAIHYLGVLIYCSFVSQCSVILYNTVL